MLKNKNIEKKFKIALVCHSLSEGGLERVVSNISYMFEKMGMQVHLHVMQNEIGYPFAGELYQYNISKTLGSKNIRKYLEIRKNIKANNYDLIIDHRYRLNPLVEFVWQKIIYRNQNVLNYIHSSKIENYLCSLNVILLKILFSKRVFISVSKGIESIVRFKFPFLKIKTIYNAISIKNFENQKITDEKFILTVARMDESNVKQIDILLECFSKSELPSAGYQLIIIGSGARKTQMETLAKELKINDKIIFKGFLSNPYSYFKNATFTVLTSRNEGLPTVLIESLMMGTPVVSFDCETGPNEIINNEENGILVENQNKEAFVKAMNRLIADKELYKKLKANTIKSVEKFSEAQIKSEWKHFIEKGRT